MMENILLRVLEIVYSLDKKVLSDGYYLVRSLVTHKGVEIFKDFSIVHESVDLRELKPFEKLPKDTIQDCGYTATLCAFKTSVIDAARENVFFDEIFGKKESHHVALEDLWEISWDNSKYILLRVNLACHRIVDINGSSIDRWVRNDKMNMYSITEYTHRIDALHEFLKGRADVKIEKESGGSFTYLKDGLAVIPSYNWNSEELAAPRFFNFWVYLDGATVDRLDRKEIREIPKEVLDISEFEIQKGYRDF